MPLGSCRKEGSKTGLIRVAGSGSSYAKRSPGQCLEDRLAEASCFALGMALVPSQDDSTASWRGTNEGR
jgi:hypothetical protein